MKPSGNFFVVTVPEDSWDVLHDSLLLDSESGAFDKELRDEIKKVLASIAVLDHRKTRKIWRWVFKIPMEAWDSIDMTLSMDAQSKWVDKEIRKQIRKALDQVKLEKLSPRDWSPRWSGG